MAKVNEDDVNQKISSIRDNRSSRRDETMLDTKISISMRTVVSVLLAVVIVGGAFLTGRYVFPSGTPLVDLSAAATVGSDVTETASEDTELEATESTSTPEEEPETSETAETVETSEETADAEPEETVEAPVNDVVITKDYANVVLEFTRTPGFEWKGTWGKLTTVYYTITNNEAGTIKPSQFRMTLEGYETADFVKIVDVPNLDSTLSPGEVTKHGVDIKAQYSESVTDPTNIRITLQLLDEDGEVMDAVVQEFNLKE